MNPYSFAVLFFAISSFVLSLLVWLKRQDTVGQLFFLFSCFVSLWGILFSILMMASVPESTALLCGRVMNGSALWLGPTWYHFVDVYTYSSLKLRHKRTTLVLYLIAVLITPFILSNLLISRVTPFLGFKYFPLAGNLFLFYNLHFIVASGLGFKQLLDCVRQAPSRARKNHFLYFIIATAIGFIGGTLSFIPVYRIPLPQYGLFIMPIYPFLVSYLIARQGLFDLEEVAIAAHQQKLMEMGMLSASINHELKNPLYIIKSRAEVFLLKRKENGSQDAALALQAADEGFQNVQDQAERAFQIVQRLTTFVRQKTFDQPVMADVSISQVMADLTPLLSHELMNHKIEMKTELSPHASSIKTDKGYLEEILFNLFLNAIQALKEKKQGGQIIFRSVNTAGRIKLEIEDNGPGISEAELKKIFNPFFTTKEQGVGLGLYVTSRLAERAGIKLNVRSQQGRGTTFQMEFA